MTASWFPDPTGRHAQRFWDGTAWTAHVADAGTRADDPLDEGRILGPDPVDTRPLDHKVFEGYLRYADVVELEDPLDVRTLAHVLDTVRTPLDPAVGDRRVTLAMIVTLVLGRRRPHGLLVLTPGAITIAWSSGGSRLLPTINRFDSGRTTISITENATTPRGRPLLTLSSPNLAVAAALPPETEKVTGHLLAQLTGTP